MRMIIAGITRLTAAILAFLLGAGGVSALPIAAVEAPAGSAGNQDYAGRLALDFTVNSTPIVVTALGVFDDLGNGVTGALTAELWSRTGGDPLLVGETFSSANQGNLNDAYRFRDLGTALTLLPGTYTIVGYRFGAADENWTSAYGMSWSQDDGGGLITFGASRWVGSTVGANTDGHTYAVASFLYDTANMPLPASLWLLGAGLAGLGALRRRT